MGERDFSKVARAFVYCVFPEGAYLLGSFLPGFWILDLGPSLKNNGFGIQCLLGLSSGGKESSEKRSPSQGSHYKP